MSRSAGVDAALAFVLGVAWPIAGLVALVGWPALAMAGRAIGEASGTGPGIVRPLELAVESLKLVGLTELLALPIGVGLAWLLFRSDLPGRRPLVGLVALVLFVPLPLQALAWLGSFGNLGRSQAIGSAPILTGHFGAAFVHAMAALPWVVLVAGVGLRSVEPELEEAAFLDLPPWRVAWTVTVRRSLGAIAGAALAVAVLTAGEMTVTDLIPLRTYAEESYTLAQLGLGQGRLAVRATLPQFVLIGLLILIGAAGLRRFDPSRVASAEARGRVWALGRWRWALAVLTWLAALMTLGLPLYGLAWRAGRVGAGLVPGQGASWSAEGLSGTIARAWGDLAGVDSLAELGETLLFGTLLWSALGATLAVGLAWPIAWRARAGGIWWFVMALAVALLLAAPGPILGLALKIAYVKVRWLQRSPALMVLGYAARALPYALLILWPALRAIPRDYLDAAEVDGLGPAAIARRVAWPLSTWAVAAAWGLAFAMALGELPTTYVTRAPGFEPVAVYVWSLLHMGVESRLAGAGLILLGMVGLIGGLAAIALRRALRFEAQG